MKNGLMLLAAVALIAVVAVPAPAGAQTIEQLQAQINALLAQIQSLTGSTGSTGSGDMCGVSIAPSLRVGSTGAGVTNAQKVLVSKGYLVMPAGVAYGYYGKLTEAAVKAYQAANGLDQVGIVGPLTAAAMNADAAAMCTPGTGTGTGTGTGSGDSDGDLEGTAGSITVTALARYSGEEVGEGEEDAKVLGVEVEADDDSDVELQSVKLEFVQGTAADSDKLEDYAQSVSVWFKGEKVGEADADSFSENNDIYTKSVSLDGVVVRAGDTEDLVVAVTALDNLDSGDIDTDSWTADILNIRFEDGDGVVTTEDTDSDTLEKTFDFADFATASDIELKVAATNDTPDSMVIDVDTTSDTDSVELLKFTIEADGSELVVDEIPVTLTVTGATDVDFVANTLVLETEDDEFSESVSTSAAAATVTFDDLDLTIAEGEKMTFIVKADLNDLDSNFEDGDTIKAEVTATNVDYIDAEDEAGESIADADATGTALGNEMAAYDVGIIVNLVSVDESVQVDDGSDDDTASFVIKYTVEAFDGTVYVADTTTATTASSIASVSGTEGVLYSVEKSGTATTADLSASVTFVDKAGDPTETGVTNGVAIEEGEKAEFTLSISRTNSGDSSDNGQFRALLRAISWATSDSSTQNYYDFDLDDYKTDYVTID